MLDGISAELGASGQDYGAAEELPIELAPEVAELAAEQPAEPAAA